jgi:hypothetical protein
VALVETAPEKGTVRIVAIDAADRDDVVAVYRSPSGELVAPTGGLFVRLAEGARADERRAELAALGLAIVKVPSYAPHSAYVRAKSGDIAEALGLVGKVAALPAVAGVEVEMHRVAQRK